MRFSPVIPGRAPARTRNLEIIISRFRVHEFGHQAALDRALNGADMKRLVADFNRDWPEVTRTREVLVQAETFAAPG